MKNKCSVIQANLHNSRCATLETLAYIRQENIDIALCQEPYNYKTSRGTYTIPGLMNQRLIANNDNRFSSCLLVNNPTLNVLHLRHLSSKYVTVVSIDGISTESVFVIAIYAPPNNDSVRNMVTKLQQILTNLQDKTVLLGGDFNCRSTIWFDTLCDRNSPVLEDFILANDLVIFNEDNLPSTFSSANGSSNIDLTLGTTDTINWVRDWTVLQDVNTSDHRVIRFTCALPLQSAASIEEYVMDCSNLKLEDIEPDLSDLCRGLLRDFPVLVSPRTIDAAVDRFYEGINRIVRAKAKKRRTYPERPEWWTSKIERLRKVYLAKKKILYTNRYPDQANLLATEMYFAKDKYKRELTKTREKSWVKFVENDLAPNPWGVVYKIATEKFRKRGPMAAFQEGDEVTLTPKQAAGYLVNKLLPDDDKTTEDVVHRIWRQDFESLQHEYRYDIQEVTNEELEQLVQAIKPKKAPGVDLMRGRLVKLVHPVVRGFMLHLYNSCLRAAYYPRRWKEGCLKILMKDPAGDPSDRKNYRPITLLTEYGKIFERLIRRRLFATTEDFHSRRQYGFISGRSAVSALLKYIETIEETTDKYAATIFIDISGAFDNVWWPAVIRSLRQKGVPGYLLATLKSYLTDRTVTYRDGSVEVSKACTKGCPQGSALGPTLWNSVLDMYLDSELLPNTETIAYADDIAIVVRARTRQELRDHIRESVERVMKWALRQKLTISGTKTKIMINKSPPRVHHRDIRVRLGDSKVGIVSEMKYLGVIVDRKLNFHTHVRAVCERARKIVLALRRKVHVTWDVPVGRSLHEIYKCGILPIVAYASEVWAHRLRVSRVRRMLLSLSGAVGRMICGGYNSVSNEAAGVLSGIPPLDLTMAETNCVKMLRRTETAAYLDMMVHREEFESLRHLREYLHIMTLDRWQSRWDDSRGAPVTHSFFPNVPEAPRTEFTRLSTQVLSGHGPFVTHLHRIGKSDTGDCPTCGTLDDPIHRSLECSTFDAERDELRVALGGIPDLERIPHIPLELLHGFAREP
jgi:hypothetical protein